LRMCSAGVSLATYTTSSICTVFLFKKKDF
jgi:hypothetical protein